LGYRVHFGRRQEIAALGDELALDRLGDRLVDDDRVLRRAEDAVVEGLARDHVPDGLLHVRRPLDEGRRVAGAHAVGRFARAVGGANQPHAAGRQDHGHVAVLHQLLSSLERDLGHPADRTGRGAGAPRRLVEYFCHARDALDGGGMGAENDRAPRLDRDEDLVDGRRGGIGRGHDGRHDAERLRNLDHSPVLVASDDADRLHWPDELVDLLRGEEVLLDLVGDHAEAGFFDRQPRERLRVSGRRVGHRGDDGVDASLVELGELQPGVLCAARERPRFRDGSEVAVRRGGGRAHGRGLSPAAWAGRIFSTSACGRGMTWTETSSPTRRAAAAPASVAALTAPTSPRTITVTYPAPIFSHPTSVTFAAFTMASAASIIATRPLVSIIPSASPIHALLQQPSTTRDRRPRLTSPTYRTLRIASSIRADSSRYV